jgi:hypothetical protein
LQTDAQKHGFELKGPPKEITPTEKATIDQDRPSNLSDLSGTAPRRKAFDFQVTQMRVPRDFRDSCAEIQERIGRPLAAYWHGPQLGYAKSVDPLDEATDLRPSRDLLEGEYNDARHARALPPTTDFCPGCRGDLLKQKEA